MGIVKQIAGLSLLLLLPAGLTLAGVAIGVLGAGCAGGGVEGEGEGAEGEGEGGDPGFDDHTVRLLPDVPSFEAVAAPSASSTALKYVITRFQQPGENLRFLKSDAY